MRTTDPNNPTWITIKAALARAGKVAATNGYVWKGESCRVVSAIALWCVMWTRNYDKKVAPTWAVDGLGPLPDYPGTFSLAYTDHYLNQRAFTGLGRPIAVANIKGDVYEGAKKSIIDLKNVRTPAQIRQAPGPGGAYEKWLGEPARDIAEMLAPRIKSLGDYLERLMQENKCRPLSNPGPEEKSWREQGATDGAEDYQANKDLDTVPIWLPTIERRARIVVPDECL